MDNIKEYTEGANLVLNGMGEAPATEADLRCFLEAGYDADTAAEDFAFYRRERRNRLGAPRARLP